MYSEVFGKPERKMEIGDPWITTFNHIQAAEEPDWSFHMHAHEDALEISYVLNGKGALYCDGKFYEISKGDIVIKNPGIWHAESSNREDPIEQICLIIDGLCIQGVPKNTLPLKGLSPVLAAEECREVLDGIHREMLRRTEEVPVPDIPFANMLLRTSLCVILGCLQSAVHERDANEHGEMMQEVRTYIDRNYARDISLEFLADHFHLSVYYLARQFRKYTSYTINKYIVSCRIGEAQRRLIHTDNRIDDIAVTCGYTNLSYFYASFRKYVGCTPTEFRNAYKNEAVIEDRQVPASS